MVNPHGSHRVHLTGWQNRYSRVYRVRGGAHGLLLQEDRIESALLGVPASIRRPPLAQELSRPLRVAHDERAAINDGVNSCASDDVSSGVHLHQRLDLEVEIGKDEVGIEPHYVFVPFRPSIANIKGIQQNFHLHFPTRVTVR